MELLGRACLGLLVAKSFYTIFLNLGEPKSVVFDEAHYGTICKLYDEGKFHIDSEPPGAKMLLCSGMPNQTDYKSWSKIGKEFPKEYSVRAARLIPALCGVLLSIAVYKVVRSFHFSTCAAAFASCLIVFDNALTVQSRFLLPDAIVLLLQSLSLYCAIGPSIWSTMFSANVVGLALSCHSSSVITWVVLCCITANKAWNIITNQESSLRTAFFRSCVHIALILLIPITVYSSIFYFHLMKLPVSGPHNYKLSSAFQATFKKGPGSSVEDVKYGRYITLRSVSKRCYLTSDDQTYPFYYEDGRVSSRQQMVTCSPDKRPNNWWLLAPPISDTEESRSKLGKDDKLRLTHAHTHGKLQAANTAAPITSDKHEVSCASPTDLAESEWTLLMSGGENWKTLKNQVQLHHTATQTLLSVTNRKMSSNDFEIVSDPDRTIWGYEETKWVAEEILSSSETDSATQNTGHEIIGFWEKLWEIHILMHADTTSSFGHRSLSSPYEWPLAQASIAYWHNASSGAQIQLVGNPVSWCAGMVAMVIYAALLCFWALGMQSQVLNINPGVWSKNVYAFAVLSGGWLLHMVWLTTSDRTMFLYNYLPALLYKHMLHACAAETICRVFGKVGVSCYCVLLAGIVHAYQTLLPVTFGHPVKDLADIDQLIWWDTWEFFGRTP